MGNVNACGTVPGEEFRSFDKQWKRKESIGKGAFGKVIKCVRRSDKFVGAAKIIKRGKLVDAKGETDACHLEEAVILSRIRHRNCIKIVDYYLTDYHLFIVTDYCEGGSIYEDFIEKKMVYPERKCLLILQQVIDAVFYLHEKEILHGDIKPANLLYETKDQLVVKLADFGTAKCCKKDQHMYGLMGTEHFMAPEVYVKKKYNQKCDIFSLGVTMFALLCGFFPFKVRIFEKEKHQKRVMQSLNDVAFQKVSRPTAMLVGEMLEFDPNLRLSAFETKVQANALFYGGTCVTRARV